MEKNGVYYPFMFLPHNGALSSVTLIILWAWHPICQESSSKTNEFALVWINYFFVLLASSDFWKMEPCVFWGRIIKVLPWNLELKGDSRSMIKMSLNFFFNFYLTEFVPFTLEKKSHFLGKENILYIKEILFRANHRICYRRNKKLVIPAC